MSGRRPWWWKPRCSWAQPVAWVSAGGHGRVGGVVAIVRRSVTVVRNASRDFMHHVLEVQRTCWGETPICLCQTDEDGVYRCRLLLDGVVAVPLHLPCCSRGTLIHGSGGAALWCRALSKGAALEHPSCRARLRLFAVTRSQLRPRRLQVNCLSSCL